MAKSLRFILPDVGCGQVVVPINIFSDLFPFVANDKNYFRQVGKFNERFEEIVEDGTPRDMYQCFREGERVRSESSAAPSGGDNNFHQGSFHQ